MKLNERFAVKLDVIAEPFALSGAIQLSRRGCKQVSKVRTLLLDCCKLSGLFLLLCLHFPNVGIDFDVGTKRFCLGSGRGALAVLALEGGACIQKESAMFYGLRHVFQSCTLFIQG